MAIVFKDLKVININLADSWKGQISREKLCLMRMFEGFPHNTLLNELELAHEEMGKHVRYNKEPHTRSLEELVKS